MDRSPNLKVSKSKTYFELLIIMNVLLLAASAALLINQSAPVAEPRVVTARGDLGADERATVDFR